jgi:hypothetical protein
MFKKGDKVRRTMDFAGQDDNFMQENAIYSVLEHIPGILKLENGKDYSYDPDFFELAEPAQPSLKVLIETANKGFEAFHQLVNNHRDKSLMYTHAQWEPATNRLKDHLFEQAQPAKVFLEEPKFVYGRLELTKKEAQELKESVDKYLGNQE